MEIHSTAIINAGAKLADDVYVGPYTIVGKNVVIKQGTRIENGCTIDGFTTIGKNCHIFSCAAVGTPPQDLNYKGEKSFLEIGDNNIIREYVTMNPGTGENTKTIIGNNNLFMAYSHVAHNCLIGNEIVIANQGTLAGHVTIEDKAILGGLAGIHQFVKMGKLSIIGGCSKAVKDIPPYSTCDGQRAQVCGLNSVGLKRAGISKESIAALKDAFRILFRMKLTKSHALEKIEKEIPKTEEISHLINFIKSSKRGISK